MNPTWHVPSIHGVFQNHLATVWSRTEVSVAFSSCFGPSSTIVLAVQDVEPGAGVYCMTTASLSLRTAYYVSHGGSCLPRANW